MTYQELTAAYDQLGGDRESDSPYGHWPFYQALHDEGMLPLFSPEPITSRTRYLELVMYEEIQLTPRKKRMEVGVGWQMDGVYAYMVHQIFYKEDNEWFTLRDGIYRKRFIHTTEPRAMVAFLKSLPVTWPT